MYLNFFIKFDEENCIAEGVNRLKNIYQKYDTPLPIKPYVILCGDIEEVKKSYVVIHNYKYSFDSLTKAVQFAFMSYKVFSLDYPVSCEHVWSFIQRKPYQINLERSLSCIDELIRKLNASMSKKK